MDSLVGFYIYALTFRLAIIAAGIVSVVLGYKLFVIGVMGGEKTRINAQAGPIKLTLANAGPGSVFALFGAFIIAVMLSQGNPELVLKDVQLVLKELQQGGVSSEVHIGSASVKGNGNSNNESSEALQRFNQAFDEAVQQQQGGNAEAAVKAYNRALLESEVPLGKAVAVFNQLAWIYREQHRIDEALALAHVATTAKKDIPEYFDTLAWILLDKEERKAAEQAAETAVDLDPANKDYRETLRQVRASQEAGQ
ncbi:MAG: hypothetical protein D3922_01725 [Candidatus Electrothrix sp. AR1]|nr:hypothetical protein [Candidatus Electrothrix sp. AR1]